MPLVELSDGWAVLVDCLAWAALSVVIGWAALRLPARALDPDRPLLRIRAGERDGRWYERRLRIGAWKDRLPEAGAAFAGGTSKRRLTSRATPALESFVTETCRAELVHWALLACGPLFLLWNPPWLGAVMVGFGLAFNLPFVAVQRYNRARLLRLLRRRGIVVPGGRALAGPQPDP